MRGIEVVSESLFGEGHRQIAFDVGTGHVWSRQVRPNSENVRAGAGVCSAMKPEPVFPRKETTAGLFA